MPLRILFMGTAELARASLRALARIRSFRRRGGGDAAGPPQGARTQAAAVACQKNLPSSPDFLCCNRNGRATPGLFPAWPLLAPDLVVVAAYGQLLPPSILELPKFGCVNVHASLLPKYRGAAPIQWAILNDEPETGVTIMKMSAGLDTGDILAQKATPIGAEETAAQLHDRLAALGAELLVGTLPAYVAGTIRPRPQDNAAATHARKITPGRWPH